MIKILELNDSSACGIFERSQVQYDVSEAVSEIIRDVAENGDAAVKKYCLKFDGADIERLEASKEEIDGGYKTADKRLISVMERAAENIREFHSMQRRDGFEIKKNGTVKGQKVEPIEKVGIYVPGGTAAYPSTVLMNCIPAKIAGCGEIIVATPPGRDGRVPAAILAAAKIAGADRVFKMGGAQAVAALAYGTETVPKVYKITGPGNAYVAEAKRQVFGLVSIDMIAGPSEILILADEGARPDYVAADMLSQAEHDIMASAVLVTTSRELAEGTAMEIEKQLKALPRQEIAAKSIENNGKIIITPDIESAIDTANEIAPEHLELYLREPFRYLKLVKNAGSVFLGEYCPEALGDYMAGPNHTLPTMGTAKFSSPLSVDDFVKKTQYIFFDKCSFREIKNDVEYFAAAEGLEGHGRSAAVRKEDGDEQVFK